MIRFDTLPRVSVNGTLMYKTFLDYREKILNLEVHDDDVWVATFPKSGTTWTQEMVWLLANDLDYAGAQRNLHERFPFLEISGINPVFNMVPRPEFLPPIEHHEDSVQYVEGLRRPRFIKTHLAWEFLPLQIQLGQKRPKIVYTARNPKDVCVSYYHHSKILDGFAGTLEEFCELFLTNKIPYCPYWNNVLDYWNKRGEDNVMFLTYEDMKADLPSVIEKVARFLNGNQPSEEEVNKLSDHLSFEAMKNNNAVNNERALEYFKKHNLSPSRGELLRSGKVGSYKIEMSPTTIAKFDEWIGRNTAGTGLRFTC